MVAIQALTNAQYTSACAECEYVFRVYTIQKAMELLKTEPESVELASMSVRAVASVPFQRSHPELWLFPLKRLVNLTRPGPENPLPQVLQGTLVAAIRSSNNSIMVAYLNAADFLGSRYEAGAGKSPDASDRALLLPKF
jgi:hypothetical protein